MFFLAQHKNFINKKGLRITDFTGKKITKQNKQKDC